MFSAAPLYNHARGNVSLSFSFFSNECRREERKKLWAVRPVALAWVCLCVQEAAAIATGLPPYHYRTMDKMTEPFLLLLLFMDLFLFAADSDARRFFLIFNRLLVFLLLLLLLLLLLWRQSPVMASYLNSDKSLLPTGAKTVVNLKKKKKKKDESKFWI